MVVRRDREEVEHKIFRDLPDLLLPGDLLVLNDTRVMPARLYGVREGTGAQIEVLLLKKVGLNRWGDLS